MEIVVDIVEAQDGILFVTGYIGKSLAVGDQLSALAVYESPKKKKQSPKKTSTIDVMLTIENILVEGEPLDTINAGQSAQIGLTGDPDPVLKLMSDHNWHKSNGRYFLPHNETRLITLSGD